MYRKTGNTPQAQYCWVFKKATTSILGTTTSTVVIMANICYQSFNQKKKFKHENFHVFQEIWLCHKTDHWDTSNKLTLYVGVITAKHVRWQLSCHFTTICSSADQLGANRKTGSLNNIIYSMQSCGGKKFNNVIVLVLIMCEMKATLQ